MDLAHRDGDGGQVRDLLEREGGHLVEAAPGQGLGVMPLVGQPDDERLVARFAELHGGAAWVEDRPGGGASFRVYLPNA